MIIEKVTLENYQCYFGKKSFEFTRGLNIVLGENGEGKTKLFESIYWVFNGDQNGLGDLVSKKAIAIIDIGETIRIGVSISFIVEDWKCSLTKTFIARKKDSYSVDTTGYELNGIKESGNGEREQVDGLDLINKVFPFQIRKYSMFKGESELDIFKSEDALINLIKLFSEARYYDKYSVKGAFLREKAERAVDDSSKLDKKRAQEYRYLESDIDRLVRSKQDVKDHLDIIEQDIRSLERNINEAATYVENASDLEIVNNRIRNLEDRISRTQGLLREDYTTALFDEGWILMHFEPIQSEFLQFVTALALEKRAMQTEFDRSKGELSGEERVRNSILNGFIPLPSNVPSKPHMEEMLSDEICKVCNREAKVGSEAYQFMYARLQDFLASQIPKDGSRESDEELFSKDYIGRLVNLGINQEERLSDIRDIQNRIKELFEFNEQRRMDVLNEEKILYEETQERAKILGNSSLAEEKLNVVLKDYNSWIIDLKRKNTDHVNHKSKLDSIQNELSSKISEKDKIDLGSAQKYLLRTRDILRDIEQIFRETSESEFMKFVSKLQESSNYFLRRINVNSFTGEIVFLTRKNSAGKIIVDLELYENGRIFAAPNESLITSMHISILFAISKLSSEVRGFSYPMIFDAPTSSFGETKSAELLNLLFETDNQKIILLKDFLIIDEQTNTLIVKKDFDTVKRDKAFWVRIQRPYDQLDLSTVDTNVITI